MLATTAPDFASNGLTGFRKGDALGSDPAGVRPVWEWEVSSEVHSAEFVCARAYKVGDVETPMWKPGRGKWMLQIAEPGGFCFLNKNFIHARVASTDQGPWPIRGEKPDDRLLWAGCYPRLELGMLGRCRLLGEHVGQVLALLREHPELKEEKLAVEIGTPNRCLVFSPTLSRKCFDIHVTESEPVFGEQTKVGRLVGNLAMDLAVEVGMFVWTDWGKKMNVMNIGPEWEHQHLRMWRRPRKALRQVVVEPTHMAGTMMVVQKSQDRENLFTFFVRHQFVYNIPG